jgi:histidine ammonia-lyase
MVEIRLRVPFYDKDRYFAPDIESIAELVNEGYFRDFYYRALPELSLLG